MFKLIKWSVISTVVLGAAGFFVLGPQFGSYFSTSFNSVRDSVRESIPVDFEIKRAEKLIRAIDPEINDCKRELARAEVELEHLVLDVGRLNKAVHKQERKLKSRRDLLTDAKTSWFEMNGRSYSKRRVELDLARTFEIYKNNAAMLESKQSLIERQSMAVAASRTKLDAVRTRKAELENTVASLKVQKQHLDSLIATSRRFDLDDSALANATEVLAEVKKRLDVQQKMIEDDIFFTDGIQESQILSCDIVKEIDAHFAQPSAEESAPGEDGLTVRTAPALSLRR
jgi:predicted  nucleic acid-binding Zn-ribbon protein